MKFFLMGLLTALPLVGNSPTTPTSITIEPAATLHNSINVITGDYYEGHVDAVVNCAESFPIHRVHVASDPKKGLSDWRFHDERLHIYMGKKGNDGAIWLTEPSGTVIHFTPTGEWGFSKKAPPTWKLRASIENFSNTSSGTLSGKTFLGNYELTFSREGDSFTLTTGSGEERIYRRAGFKHDWKRADEGKNRKIKEEVFILVKTIRPNGNRLLYTYDTRNRLRMIRSTNQAESVIFGKATFYYINDLEARVSSIVTSDGKKITYKYEQVEGHQRLVKVDCGELQSEAYGYIQPGHVTLRSHGPDNTVANEYDSKGRLTAQRITIGPRGIPGFVIEHSPIRIFAARTKLTYPSDRETEVYDALGHLTRYFYSKDHKLELVNFYRSENPDSQYHVADLHNLPNQHILDPTPSTEQTLLGAQSFTWEGSFLRSRQTTSKESVNREEVSYEYNSRGNVCKEKRCGCLRGYFFGLEGVEASELPVPPPPEFLPIEESTYKWTKNQQGEHRQYLLKRQGAPFSNDIYSRKFTYSCDGFNNLLSESYDQTCITYEYLDRTDLLIHKRICEGDELREEERFIYDENRCLIRYKRDDGYRTTTQVIQPRRSEPGYSLPEMIEDYVAKDGRLQLQKKEHLTYSSQNLVTCRKIYGSSGEFCYSLYFEYDLLGRVIRQVNALGEEEAYVYDSRGNRIEEHTPTSDTFITYDYRNQPTKIEKRDRYGTCLISHTEYDVAGNKKAQIDFSGNTTYSSFDRYGNSVATCLPPNINLASEFEWTKTERHYDIFGNLLEEIDDNGQKTKWKHNDRGQITSIYHPDGTEESYTYFLNGELRSHTDIAGLKTLYERDFKGRPLKVSLIDPCNALMKETCYAYQGDLLEQILHPDGTTTHLTYDAFGRVTEESHEGQISSYTYDTLGRMATKSLWEEEGAIVSAYSYDWNDRLIREEIQDSEGKVLSWKAYEYDYEGSQTLLSDGGSITCTEYGIAGPISHTDPLGNVTRILYNYDYSLGSFKALQKTEIDPLGNASITTYNPRSNVLLHTRKNVAGLSLAHTFSLYDPVGNKIKECRK